MNLARHLGEAGFEQIEVTEKPDWYAAERTLWEAALQADASGDPALASLQEEATQTLAAFDVRRRVLATATAPAEAARLWPPAGRSLAIDNGSAATENPGNVTFRAS
jgi:hypothetical protein